MTDIKTVENILRLNGLFKVTEYYISNRKIVYATYHLYEIHLVLSSAQRSYEKACVHIFNKFKTQLWDRILFLEHIDAYSKI